ncbi:nucleolar protein 12-domain-containing protein, partial [Bombardia bombarda]
MFAVPRQKRPLLIPTPKKRKASHKIEEISFDRDARAEYLSGFRKRKLGRIKEAQRLAEEEAKKERILVRKQIREERKQQVEEHVQTINKILEQAAYVSQEGLEGSDDEWGGIADKDTAIPEAPPVDHEEEYIDEDRYTTVTVEAVNVDKDGMHKPTISTGEKDGDKSGYEAKEQEPQRPKKEWPKKKQKFRYETKHERKITERKVKAKKDK